MNSLPPTVTVDVRGSDLATLLAEVERLRRVEAAALACVEWSSTEATEYGAVLGQLVDEGPWDDLVEALGLPAHDPHGEAVRARIAALSGEPGREPLSTPDEPEDPTTP